MLLLMIRHPLAALAAATLLCAGAPVHAQTAEPASCLEAPAAGAAAKPASGAASGVETVPRLRQLRYRCLRLPGGQRMLVGEAGAASAPAVLLVHGLGNNAHRDWEPVIQPLAARFHVIAVDLPGFGASPASAAGYSFDAFGAALSQVLEQTAPDQRVHVVGHSLGGAVSLYFAHAHAARVERLVLVDAAGILQKMVYMEQMAQLRTPQVGIGEVDRLFKGFGERFGAIKRVLVDNLDERLDFSRWLARNPYVRNRLLGRYTQVDAGLGLVEHDFTRAIRETNAPTTVIWGALDPIAPPRTGRLLEARLPDARLKVIDGAGHTPMLEAPEAFNALLWDALTAPLAPRVAPAMPEVSQGDVQCQGESGRVFRGRFDTLTLERCPDAQIKAAQMKALVIKSSTVTLDDSVVAASDVAVSAVDSEVVATNVKLSGRVAIRSDNSRFDVAGSSLRAQDKGVELVSRSWMYFSVSDWRGSDYTGDAHFIWPR